VDKTHRQTSCPEGVGRANKLSHSHKANYNQWAMLMKIKLEARGLWGMVDPGNAEFQVDRMALDVICSAMPPEMVIMLVMKDTTMEAWESNKTM
jgi:hypothetical protein